MTKNKSLLALFAAVALCLAACGNDADSQPDPTKPDPTKPDPTKPDPTKPSDPTKPDPSSGIEELRSSLQRNTSPSVPATDERELVAGNNAFAFDLYQQLRGEEEGNFFYSPASISQALAMVYAGAKGNTEAEMKSTLHYTLDQSKLHPAFNALDLALKSRGKGAQGKDGKGFRLNVVNSVWAQRGYPVQKSFLDVLGRDYGAPVRVLNFKDQPEPSRITINKWVEQQTAQRIKDLLSKGDIRPNTRMVLTNAIYFNAAWAEIFPADQSHTGRFTRLDGSALDVPRMAQTAAFAYAKDSDWQAVELPYDGHELSMVVIVPEAGKFEAVEAALDARHFDAAVGAMAHETVTLTLPKWKTESKWSLKAMLEALGMPESFTPAANFSGINGGIEALWIGDVIHQSFVAVDEKGTEAAAATAVTMFGGAPSQPVQLTVDRPFIYAIRDIASGSILFVGRMMDPTK